jgi:hypothetical protein
LWKFAYRPKLSIQLQGILIEEEVDASHKMLDESAALIKQQHSRHSFQNVEFEIEGDQIIIVDDDRVEGDSKLKSVNRWIGIDRLGDLMSLLGAAGPSELIDDISDGEIG